MNGVLHSNIVRNLNKRVTCAVALELVYVLAGSGTCYVSGG